MKVALCFSIVGLLSVVIACNNQEGSVTLDAAADTTNSNASSTGAKGVFAMYPTRDHQPTGCDQGVRLTLDHTEQLGAFAVAENFLEGFCEIFVSPDPRIFRLMDSQEDCGSKVYTGEGWRNGERYSVKITDNRGRICDDVIPSLIVLEEGDRTY